MQESCLLASHIVDKLFRLQIAVEKYTVSVIAIKVNEKRVSA